MSRWFRFYAEAMRNPKVLRLSDGDFRLWVRLLATAAENEGRIPAADDLKLTLGMRLDHLSCGLKRLISGGLIDALEVGYEPHNWSKFQYKSDSSADRVAKHRAKRNVTETPPDTDTDTEKKDDDGSACEREADFDLLRLTDEAARAAGVRHINPGDIMRNGTLVREWQQAGADPPLILATIRDDRAAPGAPNITSLRYFDTAVRRAVAQKEATANGHESSPLDNRTGTKPVYRRNPGAELLRRLAAEANAGTPGGDSGTRFALPLPS